MEVCCVNQIVLFLPSFPVYILYILLMKSPITSIGFYFNLMIKTIGLHRYLVKYIYSTLSHVLAFHCSCLFVFSQSFSSAVPPVSYSSLCGEACAVVPILHLYKTGQNSSAQRHLVNSKPFTVCFFPFYVFFFSFKKHVKSIQRKVWLTTDNSNDEMYRG